MNCHDFHERLQRCLDDRIRPESDRELVRHTKQCEGCRGQLDAWHRVSSLMPELRAHGGRGLPRASQRERNMRWTLGGSAMAASLVFVMFTSIRDPEPDSPPRAGAGESITQSLQAGSQTRTLAEAQRNLDPVRWWEQVHDRDWVGQTMPTVRSVQQGVAPLGRTLMRAVNILAIGGRDQTS